MQNKQFRRALISVFNKDGLESVLKKLNESGCQFISTGGTEKFIKELGYEVTPVETLTGYPSILGGRVKTLHPAVFGGILGRTEEAEDRQEMATYKIDSIDLVIVDLYPFEETVKSGAKDAEIIEKIDIGGISLIRAAAKNYKSVLVVSHKSQYKTVETIIERKENTIATRQRFAKEAFMTSSHYDTQIWQYFGGNLAETLTLSIDNKKELRYGENPHQKGFFYGDINDIFEIYGGKELSYNNLLDVDAALNLINEFQETAVAILKHNNACGVAIRSSLVEAWKDALAGDPVSAFGGIVITNRTIDFETAKEIDKLFYEVLIAPGFEKEALELLQKKSKRILMRQKETNVSAWQYRSVLNGALVQEKDLTTNNTSQWEVATNSKPTNKELDDLYFANILAKHTKSNTIVLAKNKQLIGSGTGQTSRVDALRQAIAKTHAFGFDTHGSVMASDAFFPFADSVEIASEAGITAVIQPGGSIKDKDSIDFCNNNNISMIMTGMRHFKH
ncbi:MAG: bifunctional phosphoribosylaminoimidazolecarboxamide formyltransferase/IMP cyclohydrolase [Salinivirgaceae bacterium]|nr:bifunctional phosphoribosylaminoimidazolecarboxamide formyltransferase/IMP cyclohydrolase [Salinivirgaceae bacterium]MDD4745884.1 bifunctional phosphoribosylaminoimidazolecarboxamide formyltransferase/IMP cyclohydrolase [Salinivirgaceae bacterium]MDY0278949.1 bifunctional phosphoribosylaminoimidazolecarboxamide formyltransferase/IMP cyclohydrolase [Salinivirgaceae bacterium]